MRRVRKDPPPLPELKKGMLLVLKTPPYYTKCYLYEVTSAGDQLIRASLYHSPKVRKSWSIEELRALFEHQILRLATEDDVRELTAGQQEQAEPDPKENSAAEQTEAD